MALPGPHSVYGPSTVAGQISAGAPTYSPGVLALAILSLSGNATWPVIREYVMPKWRGRLLGSLLGILLVCVGDAG
jgi:hypothetical protein